MRCPTRRTARSGRRPGQRRNTSEHGDIPEAEYTPKRAHGKVIGQPSHLGGAVGEMMLCVVTLRYIDRDRDTGITQSAARNGHIAVCDNCHRIHQYASAHNQ
jgi:hypothetical protein